MKLYEKKNKVEEIFLVFMRREAFQTLGEKGSKKRAHISAVKCQRAQNEEWKNERKARKGAKSRGEIVIIKIAEKIMGSFDDDLKVLHTIIYFLSFFLHKIFPPPHGICARPYARR